MKFRKSLFFTLVLTVSALLIHFWSNDSTRVENWYTGAIYPAISRFLRYLFGWLPFSMGDLLYALAIGWLLWKLAKAVKALFKKQVNRQSFAAGLGRLLRISLVIYILFNCLWGINYNRQGIASQLQLKMDKYSLDDLNRINRLLVQKTNVARQSLDNAHAGYPSNEGLFAKIDMAYRQAEKTYPFLEYKPVSLKPSMWSWVGNYMGFTGYYNPFTGEAQVNTLVPKFLQPFTSCHEVAHQLGYAKEMEANFVGYLAARASPDTLLHYSVYLDLFMYSNRNLFVTDSVSAKQFRDQLSPAVVNDLKEWRSFYNKHRNPVEPVFRWIYGVYLRQNQQPQGVLSYDEVTAFIIAYYKKYGSI